MAENANAAATANAPRRINVKVLSVAAIIVASLITGIFFAFKFVEDERARNLAQWQIRLGIVADSRAAAVNEWVSQNFANLRELAENASLQLYMTELSMAEGDEEAVTDQTAQAGYLRNLLIATGDRTGFKAPADGAGAQVQANVERVGVAGIGLVDAQGKPLVSSPGMPPISGKIRTAVAQALEGEPAIVDLYMGATNLPTMGFVLPIYGVQDDEGAAGIGAVIGVRVVGADLFSRLAQPGTVEATAETYLVRRTDGTVEYLSPLADGTPAMKRSLAADTPDLAATYAAEAAGGFAIKRDYSGEEVLVTSRPIAGLPWVLVRKISRAEALAATDTRLRTMLTVFVLIIVGVAVTLIAVWRHGSSLRAAQAAENYRIAAERMSNLSKFMRVVTNSQHSQIVAVAGDTVYTFANEPAARVGGISPEDMRGKTMASVIGPVKAKYFDEINQKILRLFDESDDAEGCTETHVRIFDEGEETEEVIRSLHVPLRGDRDFPPAVLMIIDDLTDITRERRRHEQILNQLISTLVSLVDRRDPFSANHSIRVAEVAHAIAKDMGLPEAEVRTLDAAGRLMNLGKIFVPTELLTKTENLTAEEREQLATAYLASADVLTNVPFDGPVVETIRQMGETWEGGGPLGLRGEDILFSARILGVVNAFVAMVSARAYRAPMTFEKASAILLQDAGTKFDRRPVSALINYLDNRGGAQRWSHFREKPAEGRDPAT